MHPNILFTPATKRFLSKKPCQSADIVVIDIEDSIREDDRSDAIQFASEYIQRFSQRCNKLFIRFNKEDFSSEMKHFIGLKIDGFVVPKIETNTYLDQVYTLAEGKLLFLLIESPLGIVNLSTYDLSYDGLVGVALGAEDYAAKSMRLKCSSQVDFAQQLLILYGNAYSIPVYDKITWNFKDSNLLLQETRCGYDCGFSGKLAIHPKQLKIIDMIYKNSDCTVYNEILEKWSQSSEGVVEYNGEIYEKMHIDLIKKIILKNEGEK